MQTKSLTALRFIVAPTLFISLIFSCQKSQSLKQEILSTKSNASAIKKDNASNPANPHFNLEVILRGEGKRFGHVKFRQADDAAKIVTFEVWVRDLEPNHQYLLQRAVDTNLDGNCTGTTWLTLGEGLQPQTITTNEKGTGGAELWRDLSTLQTGATFDIHFRVVDAATMTVVLTSGCYEYTVR